MHPDVCSAVVHLYSDSDSDSAVAFSLSLQKLVHMNKCCEEMYNNWKQLEESQKNRYRLRTHKTHTHTQTHARTHTFIHALYCALKTAWLSLSPELLDKCRH